MSDRLNPGDSLAVGGSIPSLDGGFTLTLQADGNLGPISYWWGSRRVGDRHRRPRSHASDHAGRWKLCTVRACGTDLVHGHPRASGIVPGCSE
jgi:hypothetical protein